MTGPLSARLRRVARRLRPQDTSLVVPRRTRTSQEYARDGRARWISVEPAGPVTRRTPTQYGRLPSRLLDHVVASLPELGVLVLPEGAALGTPAWVVTPDQYLLPDLSWHADLRHRQRRTERVSGRRFQVQRLEGVCLSLATFSSWRNYGHFLLDSAPRIHLAERAGFAPAAVDHVIIGAPHAGARALLARLGVPLERAISAASGVAYQADRLVAPSFPGVARNYPGWVPAWLRERLGPSDARPHRNLFVTRSRGRMIRNFEELRPILDEHGFELFEPSADNDPIGKFAEARVVIGTHGAALADLAFCRPGTAVLEHLPSRHQMPYYYTLADSAGLDYGYLVGESAPEAWSADSERHKADFSLDAREFRDAVEATLARAPGP